MRHCWGSSLLWTDIIWHSYRLQGLFCLFLLSLSTCLATEARISRLFYRRWHGIVIGYSGRRIFRWPRCRVLSQKQYLSIVALMAICFNLVAKSTLSNVTYKKTVLSHHYCLTFRSHSLLRARLPPTTHFLQHFRHIPLRLSCDHCCSRFLFVPSQILFYAGKTFGFSQVFNEHHSLSQLKHGPIGFISLVFSSYVILC